MTSSTLALESDMRVVKRAVIREKSFTRVRLISPITVSMSSCEVTIIQARPPQVVPRVSVMVWRLSINWEFCPMKAPTSSAKNNRRWSGPFESRYSFTQRQKFSTVREKLASAFSYQLVDASTD